MADPGEVVIVGADGTEHVFPPGFDPRKAAAIVRGGGPAVPPAAPSTSGLDRLLSLLPTAGGAIGGIAGGVGGTAFGLPAPGALAGAGIGGAAGTGLEQLLKHLGEIPGALKDVAGNALSQPAATLKGAARGAGQGLKDAGLEGGLQALYELGGKAVTGIASTAGRAVYRGYLKPSLAKASLAKAGEIVETGIREAIPVTESGAAKAEGLISDLRAETDRILANTTGDVDLHTVADKLRAWGQKVYNRPGRAPADLEAVMKVADRIDNHPSMIPKPPAAPVDNVSLTVANQAKRDMQSGASTAYGLKSGAEKSAEKVGGSLLRQGIEDVAPAVSPLNTRQSQLIDLAKALNRATGREGNRNALFGVPSMMAGASGAAELAAGAGKYGAGAMALAVRMGLTPNVATRAAILAAKMGDKVPGTAVADVARIAVQTVSQSQQ